MDWGVFGDIETKLIPKNYLVNCLLFVNSVLKLPWDFIVTKTLSAVWIGGDELFIIKFSL